MYKLVVTKVIHELGWYGRGVFGELTLFPIPCDVTQVRRLVASLCIMGVWLHALMDVLTFFFFLRSSTCIHT